MRTDLVCYDMLSQRVFRRGVRVGSNRRTDLAGVRVGISGCIENISEVCERISASILEGALG